MQPKPEFDLAAAKECEAALMKLGAQFSVTEPAEGEGQCGWPRPLSLKRLSRGVSTVGKSMLRCEVALALTRWTKEVVAPSAKLHLDKDLATIVIDPPEDEQSDYV